MQNNLIVSLASLPQIAPKNLEIMNLLATTEEGFSTDRYSTSAKPIINNVVGSCVFYKDFINYENLNNFSKILVANRNEKVKKKIMVVDLREDSGYGANKLLLNNELVTVVQSSFYQFIKTVSRHDTLESRDYFMKLETKFNIKVLDRMKKVIFLNHII